MAHVRKSIRDNVTTTLTGLATTGANVYQTRFYPLAEAKVAGLCIYTNSEDVEYTTLSLPRTQMRSLEVMVEAYVKGTANIDDTLDTIAVEISEALAVDVTRGGKAKDTKVTRFEATYAGEGDQPVGVGSFTVEVLYATLENDLETAV
tara:strand:- start:107 stop:550 length:444 start_codon:yes stop_codon:yes gene_type:complete